MVARKQRGFSTVEMLVAMAILLFSLSAVVLVLFGNQSLGVDSELNAEALSRAQALLEEQQALARKDFNLVNPTSSTEVIGGLLYAKQVDIDRVTPTDYLQKRVRARVSWVGEHGRVNQYVQLNSLITDFPNTIGSNTCYSELSGNWSAPTRTDYPLASGGSGNLLPSPPAEHTFSAKNPIRDIDVYKGVGAVAVGNTTIKTDDSIFFFNVPVDGSRPVYTGSMDNATSTIVGPNAVRIADNYVYLANGAPAQGDFGTCVNNNDLSDTSTKYAINCGQLQIIHISDPANPRLIYNFKVPGVSGTGAQGVGKSLYYRAGYLYLGLTKTASGPEFAIVDVHNPTLPIARGTFSVGRTVNAIWVNGYYAYLTTDDNTSNELMVLDISNPNAPTLAAGAPYNPPGFGYGTGLAGVGDTLYFGKSFNGGSPEFSILDISHPLLPMPAPLGTHISGFSIVDVLVRDYLAFLLSGNTNTLRILNVTNPSSLSVAANVTLPGTGMAMDCEGAHLYIGSASAAGDGFISILGSS